MDIGISSEKEPLGVDIYKVAAFYGNRRTVVLAFLKDKSKSPEVDAIRKIDVFELIELQLGYPIPSKIKKLL